MSTDTDVGQLQDRFYRYQQSKILGLAQAWVYHCCRCNHCWLPEHFDYCKPSSNWGNDTLFFRPPPKACARCKSKLWREPIIKRKSKGVRVNEYGHIVEPASSKRFNSVKHDMEKTIKIWPERIPDFIRTLETEGNLTQDELEAIKKELESIKPNT